MSRRRRALATLTLALTLASASIAVLLERGGDPAATAFARAPDGHYVVVARSAGAADVIMVVGATPGGVAIEVATVPHLYGFGLRGAVGPNGRHLALIAVDGGVPAKPVAALLALHLETGQLHRLAEGVDPLQDALWTPDASAVIVTRSEPNAGARARVSVVRVDLSGVETVIEVHRGVLAVAPVGFDATGELLAVVLDERGSTLTRGGAAVLRLSAHLTRDWALSPDRAQLAFVEANLARGLRYLPRVVAIEGGGVSAAAVMPAGQALGAAWPPAGAAPRFGTEPGGPRGGVSAQSATGFDVPLGYSRDGGALAVRRWSGASFAEPGAARLQIVSAAGRQPLTGFTRFFGWAAR